MKDNKLVEKYDDNPGAYFNMLVEGLNEEFDEVIKSSILTKRSKLIETSLDRLKRGLVNTYKDIF